MPTGFGSYVSPARAGAPILSGQVFSGLLADNSVLSGTIASGQVSNFHLASGAVGPLDLASGAVQSGDVASGAVLGQAGGGAFSIASGTLGTYDHGSGCIADIARFTAPVYSGTGFTLLTEETVSGLKAVCISQSGNVRVAMAAVSGRMPAVGVVMDNVLSGIQANIYTQGIVKPTSGLFTAIGFFGQPVWVGRSGQLCPLSGSFGSGGFASGDIGQKMGVGLAVGSGGIFLHVDIVNWSGGPLGEATGGTV